MIEKIESIGWFEKKEGDFLITCLVEWGKFLSRKGIVNSSFWKEADSPAEEIGGGGRDGKDGKV